MNPMTDASASDEATTMDEEMEARLYELCLLYPNNISQKEEADLLKEVEELFEEPGGVQVSKDLWGRRGLAYPIKKHDEGRYAIYHYQIDPEEIKEIDTALRIMPNVLRHLIIKPPKGYIIEKYSEKYEQWLKDRENEEVEKEAAKEEALKKKITEKARKEVEKSKKAGAAPAEEAAPVEEEKITEEIEKLISDDDLDI